MPRTKARRPLPHLREGERALVLDELLRRYPDLQEEANDIAEAALDDVSVENVAEQVGDLITSVGWDELNSRAGRHADGYVEPEEAAWQLFEEAIEPVQLDMQRRFESGRRYAAEQVCQGIILGLYGIEPHGSDGVLAYAPEFATETAGYTLSQLLELYPQRQRRPAGNRILAVIEELAEDWVEMLDGVIRRATTARKRPRR